MKPTGPKIAEGRDSEIFEHGDGRVLRVNFVARDLRPEARIMGWVRDHGYPVPEVFDAGDGWLVMETADGPVVIDWSNARAGRPATDVANTWCLLKCGEIPLRGPAKWLSQIGRGLLVARFLGYLDAAAAREMLPAIVEWRHSDRNHSEKELTRMRRLERRVVTRAAR